MSDEEALKAIEHLDFKVELACESIEHGKWGSILQPAEYMVLLKCAAPNKCFEMDILSCGPCFTAQRKLYCRTCGIIQSPEQMMHFKGKV